MSQTKSTYLTVLGILLSPFAANADQIVDFTGVYDISTWTTQLAATTTNTTVPGSVGTGGSVDTSSAPTSVTLIEPNNFSGLNYEIQFLNTAAGDGVFSFDWLISGDDLCCGSANVYIGDTAASGYHFWSTDSTDLLWTFGIGGMSGTFSGSILAGQAFGFGMNTADDCCGSITLMITNFSAPGIAVPEPGTLALFSIGLFGIGLARRKKI